MKTAACFLLLLLLGLVPGRADPLGARLTVTPVEGWRRITPEFKGPAPLPTVAYAPVSGEKVRLLLTAIPDTADQTADRAWLRNLHRMVCGYFLPHPDAPIRAVDFQFRGGLGLYATFEDPAHVGQPAEPDDYRFATVIALAPRGGDGVHATIFSDNVTSTDYQRAMQIVRSVTVKAPAAPVRPSTTAPVAAQDEVEQPELDAGLRFPAGEFERSSVALNPHPGYFSLVHQSGIVVSGWLDHKEAYPGFRAFWAREKQTLATKLGMKVEDEEMKLVAGWQVMRYTVRIGEIVQANLRACRVVGSTWAGLHLSRTGGATPDWEALEAVLKTITLAKREPSGAEI